MFQGKDYVLIRFSQCTNIVSISVEKRDTMPITATEEMYLVIAEGLIGLPIRDTATSREPRSPQRHRISESCFVDFVPMMLGF